MKARYQVVVEDLGVITSGSDKNAAIRVARDYANGKRARSGIRRNVKVLDTHTDAVVFTLNLAD